VAAGSPGASDRERRDAERLATGLPLQYLTEAKALKVPVRDLDTGKVIGLIRRWSERPGLLSDRRYTFADRIPLCSKLLSMRPMASWITTNGRENPTIASSASHPQTSKRGHLNPSDVARRAARGEPPCCAKWCLSSSLRIAISIRL
jgi:hypothetical protein